MSKWFVYNKKDNYQKLNQYHELSNIQKLILANRDIVEEGSIHSIIDSSIENMHDPFLMKDMEKAVDQIIDSMMQGESIRIIGDYDQDGVAATTILVKGLRQFYDKVSYSIPDRMQDGYGLSINLVNKALEDGVNLLITCDNGIAAFEAIEYAIKNGTKVIITDHHQVIFEEKKQKLPTANAIVNPSQVDCNYPFKKICGALVAYKLIFAIYMKYGEELGIHKNKVVDLLQYAALGTVTDVMDLVDENRIVVVEGLKILNNTTNIGLIELLEQLNWRKEIDVYTIGFVIGPTINATGRLYTAKLASELFLDNDIDNLRIYAQELIALNNERKELTIKSVEKALNDINNQELYKQDIIVLKDSSIHESICGLVAGRIKEAYNKPVIVLTETTKNDKKFLKGSGRSIEAYDMHKNLTQLTDLFTAFGGHKMACGLTMPYENFEEFVNAVNFNSNLSNDDFVKIINIDAALDFNHINFNLINEIEKLKPFGKGFEKPHFASKSVIIKNIGLIGAKKNVLKMQFMQNGKTLDAISFNPELILSALEKKYGNLKMNFGILLNQTVDIVYTMSINSFNGQDKIQLNLEEIR